MRAKLAEAPRVDPPPRLASLRRLAAAVAGGLAALLAAVASPGAVIGAMLIAGAGCAVAGVYLLAGPAWALIAAAAILFALAGVALRGGASGV